MTRPMRVGAALLVGAVLAAAALYAFTRLLTDEGREPPPSTTVTVAGKRVVIDPGTQLEHDEVAEAADATPADEGPDLHEDLRDESPAGAPADAAREVKTNPTDGFVPRRALGGAQNYSCARRFVQNHSTRAAGVKVKVFVLHYTVSRPGSLDAIRRLFNTPSFGASSTFGLEPSGRCEQWVPFDRKAWTQGAFNSTAESVEIIAQGNEPRSWWLAQPLFKRGILAALVADRLRVRGLPPRYVNPEGCAVQNAGYTDHESLECGNSHHDVKPAFPFDVFERQVTRAFYGGNPVPIACTPRNIEKVAAQRRPTFKIVVDGVIGNRSRAAIRSIQKANYVRVDGVVGPRTGRVMGLEGCGAT